MVKQKKISRVFRLTPSVVQQLDRRSEVTGITKTRILENALALYFSKGMKADMKNAAEKIASFNPALGQPQELPMAA